MNCNSTCDTEERCYCYTNHFSTDPTMSQTCAREDIYGRIIKCQPGCCNSNTGCPGQCTNALMIEPERINENVPIIDKTAPFIYIYKIRHLMSFLILLVIISTGLILSSNIKKYLSWFISRLPRKKI